MVGEPERGSVGRLREKTDRQPDPESGVVHDVRQNALAQIGEHEDDHQRGERGPLWGFRRESKGAVAREEEKSG